MNHAEYIEDSIEVKPNQVYGLNNAQYIEDSIEVKPNPVYVAYMEESTVTVTVEYETVSPTNSVTLHENNQGQWKIHCDTIILVFKNLILE